MDWLGLHRLLKAKHPGDLQRIARIELALREAQSGLDALASLGYRFWLSAEPQPAVPPYPRVVFHVDAAPNGRLVYGEAEHRDLGPGWFGTLEEAQHWDGIAVQFAGRGGVHRMGLPAAQSLDLAELLRQTLEAAEAKARRIEEFKRERGAERGTERGQAAAEGQAHAK